MNIHKSWVPYLEQEFNKPYFDILKKHITQEYKQHQCYPPGKDILNAFEYCHFNATKVVIIGQDPYHGPGQANGLCFSVSDGIPHPPSLVNIFKELEQDTGKPYPVSGNLEPWAKQGVLLLNATLTVRAHQAGSHQKMGWETFTDQVIKTISENKEGVIFLLWGGFAKKKSSLINNSKHHVFTSGHPSPLSANRGYWFGNKHFSKVNEKLLALGKAPINW